MANRVVTVAVTGASGAPYFIQLLRSLFLAEVKVYLLLSSAAKVVIKTELNLQLPEADHDLKSFFLEYFNVSGDLLEVYGKDEWTAPVASGTNPADAMVVCPCSMGSLSAIAHGASNNLIERAADVMLKERRQLIIAALADDKYSDKERRQLILLTREMPYSSIHLENMLRLSQSGVTIMPASPGFYHQPESIDDLVNFVVARILDHMGIKQSLVSRWG